MKTLLQSEFQHPASSADPLEEPLILHRHATDQAQPTSVVVLVHGLGGTRYGKNATWGKLPEFLFADLPNTDIAMYGYRTLFGRLKFTRSIEVEEEAETLACQLRDNLKHDNIILVGHSLGGLLCQTALWRLHSWSASHAMRRIRGMVLMATPQAGSLRVPRLLGWFSRDAKALQAHGKLVREVQSCLSTHFELREERGAAGRIHLPTWAILSNSDFWVDPLSAKLGLPHSQVQVTRGSHQEIVKPSSTDTDAYRFLLARVRPCLEDQNYATERPDTASQHRTERFHVPIFRNRFFSSRSEVISQIAGIILTRDPHESPKLVLLTGLGGIGKSQIALECAFQFREHFDAVIWIDATDESTIKSSIYDASESLGISPSNDFATAGLEETLQILRRSLQGFSRPLIIADDITNSRLIEKAVLPNSACHVIATSRDRSLFPQAHRIDIEVLSSEESVELIRRRLADTHLFDPVAATALANALGGLPLAIEQAASYISRFQTPIDEYLAEYNKAHLDLLEKSPPESSNYSSTVRTTWQLSTNRIRESSPEAADILVVLGHLGSAPIPTQIVSRGIIPEITETGETSDMVALETIEPLHRMSMVTTHGASRTIRIHQLVQAVSREANLKVRDREPGEVALSALSRLARNPLPETWREWSELLPHAIQTIERNQAALATSESKINLSYYAADFLDSIGRYGEAESEYRRALAAAETHFGPRHIATSEIRTDLGSLLSGRLGRFREAHNCIKTSLEHQISAIGPENPRVAQTKSCLALVLSELGEADAAYAMMQDVLTLKTKFFGPTHESTWPVRGNLALAKWRRGDAETAEREFRALLREVEVQKGRGHFETIIPTFNLSAVLASEGQLDEATSLLLELVTTLDSLFPGGHPQTRVALSRVVLMLGDQGRFGEAEPLAKRSLSGALREFGRAHPATAEAMLRYTMIRNELSRPISAEEAAQLLGQ